MSTSPAANITSVLKETRVFPPPAEFAAQAHVKSLAEYEALWQRALAIHRRAIVVDTHNDITTPMTNDDFDLSGNPPYPYRTNIDRF